MSLFARRLQRASQSTASLPGSPITHGDQINPSNVGYTAYFDAGLGRNLVLGDLTVVSGTHWVSDFISSGGTLSKKHFTGSMIIDIDNVTFTGCLFDTETTNYLNGSLANNWALNYCTIDGVVVGDQGISYQSYTATRCLIQGFSDGVKANGGSTTLTECYIRTKAQSAADHNDGIQNVGGNGAVNVIRCNIDCLPVNGGQYGLQGNSALFFADGEIGLHTVYDNLLYGGVYTLAMYDAGTFDVQGNKFVRGSYIFGTHNMAGPGSGSQNVTWGTIRTNTFSDNGQVIPL